MRATKYPYIALLDQVAQVDTLSQFALALLPVSSMC